MCRGLDRYHWSIRASGRAVVRQKHQFSISLVAGQNHNRLVYSGTDNIKDSYGVTFASGNIRYRFQTKKYSFSAFTGAGFEPSRKSATAGHLLLEVIQYTCVVGQSCAQSDRKLEHRHSRPQFPHALGRLGQRQVDHQSVGQKYLQPGMAFGDVAQAVAAFLRDSPVLQSVGAFESEYLCHLHRQLRKEGPSWQRDGDARQRSFSHHAVTGATA